MNTSKIAAQEDVAVKYYADNAGRVFTGIFDKGSHHLCDPLRDHAIVFSGKVLPDDVREVSISAYLTRVDYLRNQGV